MSKFIDGNYFYVVTNTSPATFIVVDITLTPPTYTIYTLNVGGETYENAKALALNAIDQQAYVACKDGLIAKIDLANPNTRVELDVGENVQLETICHLPDFRYTFSGDNLIATDLFVIDETTKSHADTKFNWIVSVQKAIQTFFTFLQGKVIDTKINYSITSNNSVDTDLRWLLYDYSLVPLYAYKVEDVTLTIGGAACTDVLLPSIKINLQADNKGSASFTLPRRHDKIDYTIDNVYQQISNQNAVIISIGTKVLFNGKISKLNCNSESESIDVSCECDETTDYRINQKINLPLVTKGTQLHLYDVLLNSIDIDNPSQPSTLGTQSAPPASPAVGDRYLVGLSATGDWLGKENQYATCIKAQGSIWKFTTPEVYNGIVIDLGNQETERSSSRRIIQTDIIDLLNEGTFEFLPNYTYFWWVGLKKFGFGTGYVSGSSQYIGTSLIPITTDLYEVVSATYHTQRIEENTITSLGDYTIGTAPYQTVSCKNGRYISTIRYVDKQDGFYHEKAASYDYVSYAQRVAVAEYSKICNINGTVLPKTSANIDLTIDAYLYYNIFLLTRLNLVNTTQSGIYTNLNGFPVAVKSISIDVGQMKISLNTDNAKSNYEMELLDFTLAQTEPQEIEATSIKINSKYNPEGEEIK